MLTTKRRRKQNSKYSDFVETLGLRKDEKSKKKKVGKQSSLVATAQDCLTSEGDVEEVTVATTTSLPHIIEALPPLLHSCPHHDVLVTTSDHALVSCHALILSLASPVLSDLLREQVVEEGGMMRLVMENMTKDQLFCLLEFAYTGRSKPFKGLEVIEIFSELQVVFAVEAFDEYKADTEYVSDIGDIIFESCESEIEQTQTEKKDIIQVLATLENKENQLGHIGGLVNTAGLKKTCDYCHVEFNTFVLLKRHIRDHHGMFYDTFLDKYGQLKPFKCDYCDDQVKTFFQLKSHVKKVHGEEWERFCTQFRIHECCKCQNKFFTKTEMRRHERKVHKYFKTKKLPNGKYESRKPISVNIEDGLPFNHERKCSVCGKLFSNAENFTDHMNAHLQGEKPYSCEYCDFKCARRKNLKKHTALHIVSETLLLCKDCGNLFESQYELKKHRKEYHNQRIMGIKKAKRPQSKIYGDYMCEKCGQHFSDQQKYRSHIKYSHVPEDEKFQCLHCPHKSITSFSLKMHQALHFPPTLPCEKCGKLFHTKLYLTRHIKQNHADESEKDFQCGQCGKGFVTRDSYEGHLSMHAGVKPIQCRYCDMRYQNRSNAIAHEKKVHKDLYTRKSKSLGGVRVKDRMEGKEIIGLNKVQRDKYDPTFIPIADHDKAVLLKE